ncbi:MAG TPA: Rrf2 family transcriptional regulator [Desulfitobacteriaceae bacterium]|nr:Rrf2 family transcriptional regulator [Desulfitobacteriaceae bacterium]
MKISSKGRYGLRSMVDLAACGTEEHVSLGIIAARQNISENYLEQVFSILRKAGLVKSVKGAQGGYILARQPSKIKVGDILRALEGSLDIVDNAEEDNAYPVSIQNCIKANVWDKINESINQVVDTITLQDLANEYQKMNQGNAVMYYI